MCSGPTAAPGGVCEPLSTGGDGEAGGPHNTPGILGNRARHKVNVHASPTRETRGVASATRGMAE